MGALSEIIKEMTKTKDYKSTKANLIRAGIYAQQAEQKKGR